MCTAFLFVIIVGIVIGMIASYFEYKTWGQVFPAVVFGAMNCFLVIGVGIALVRIGEHLIIASLVLVGLVGLIAAPAIVLKCIDKKKRG